MADLNDDATTALHKVGDAIADVCQAQNEEQVAPIVTRFYVIAETISEDGARGLEAFRPGDVSLWDAIGMLEFELAVERGKIESAQTSD
jgi:hypothetical protein